MSPRTEEDKPPKEEAQLVKKEVMNLIVKPKEKEEPVEIPAVIDTSVTVEKKEEEKNMAEENEAK